MTGKISLTASMRSNLLSLQNISRQVSSTQNKLATGNKVNSAIDNPSSYYTARALNNRADDLNALLDSMGQAISTIKAATTALETGAAFLEQAAAVATQALETTSIPAKSYFEERVGENGAVVTTAQELKDAAESGKETICVYGTIDYFENEGIRLKDGQKLVGTEYFTGYTGKEKFSKINFRGNQENAIYISKGKYLFSDLEVNFRASTDKMANIFSNSSTSDITANNLDLMLDAPNTSYGNGQGAFSLWEATLTIDGVINLNGKSFFGGGFFLHKSSATVNPGAVVNINAAKNDFSTGSSYGIMLYKSALDVLGTINISGADTGIILQSHVSYGGNILNLHRGGELNINAPNGITIGAPDKNGNINQFNCESGAILNLKNDNTSASFIVDANFSQVDPLIITASTPLTDLFPLKPTKSTVDWNNFLQPISQPDVAKHKTTSNLNIINQYDNLIKDSSYKGINLLQNDGISVKFNEKNTASLNISGKNMSATALGITTTDWTTQEDIAQSLAEIASALKSIRAFSAELGNNYSIITSRQDFTENLINILTEGADKLTLADMNEESANMLALQTRQQLAVNSLSLASQASQSVLRLF